ncbi:TPA: type IVB secretion system protein IcmX [Legionella pneumophila]|uniref:Type IV secretion protein IcmX n=1 Tax=Legionella pneumophila subsp. pneumophila TaxID=91891 RepID=A0A3A6VMA7_LEGPN|nr:type IVB secretion system protein IcmX [Legionella pneumophila]ERH45664.1 intracellular multiplication protein IcmX [Legionella pneumophila str. Leg01/53]ERH46400.1 intracellular multiplication protein IcmX [Legionella pneumophila str. Leg01/11]ERI49511.1 intracellular multiplication protein IcmX [Legionella pneumophila str. Leg01/20]ANN96716.1 type IV secretion protein IcmX [Legionella pneumophila]AOU11643.1 type IV secretion protein IcmX [Legionella pneumophila]
MKVLPKLALANLFCFTTLSVSVCAQSGIDTSGQQTSTNTSNLVTYLTNLGKYLGYDITQSNKTPNPPYSQLFNSNVAQLIQNYAYNTFLGAIPVNAMSQSFMNFVTQNVQGSSLINNLANNTFKYQNFSTPSSGLNGTVSANSLIDQSTANAQAPTPSGVFSDPQTTPSGTYLKDPVSQAVFNILGTPDYSFCMDNEQKNWLPNCNLMYQNLVMQNVIGTLPPAQTSGSTPAFYTYNYNQSLIGQLNGNSLIAPLLLDTNPAPLQQLSSSGGLKAISQAQQALNFIRYASAQVTPPSLPKLSAYSELWNQATAKPNSDGYNEVQQKQAAATLSGYFNNLRVYAAQTSVGVSNLYYILSKRLPQNMSGDQSNQNLTSQALNEFNMATRRLFDPTASNTPGQPNQQWIKQINDASPATVQKEIAVLLAEINYQMYLDRQIQERILLTNSIMLLQNLKAAQPTADFSSQGSPSEQ